MLIMALWNTDETCETALSVMNCEDSVKKDETSAAPDIDWIKGDRGGTGKYRILMVCSAAAIKDEKFQVEFSSLRLMNCPRRDSQNNYQPIEASGDESRLITTFYYVLSKSNYKKMITVTTASLQSCFHLLLDN